jgi:hypothetical protein
MIENLLRAAALPARAAWYPDPPAGTFAVWQDNVEASGADGRNLIYTHDVMVELYEPTQDDAAETAFEAVLNAQGIPWTKQARYWLKDTRRYQVIYEFSYIEKRSE